MERVNSGNTVEIKIKEICDPSNKEYGVWKIGTFKMSQASFLSIGLVVKPFRKQEP